MDDALLHQVRGGDAAARGRLLARFRLHLYRMVATRLDRRLRARLDASDVIQEILTEADGRLDAYLAQQPPPLPPLGWLQQIANDRITDVHRRHLGAECRALGREQIRLDPSAEPSELIQSLIDSQSSPSQQVVRVEQLSLLRATLAGLPDRDRQVLTLRYLEHRDVRSIAEALELSEPAVKARILRALLRLRDRLGRGG